MMLGIYVFHPSMWGDCTAITGYIASKENQVIPSRNVRRTTLSSAGNTAGESSVKRKGENRHPCVHVRRFARALPLAGQQRSLTMHRCVRLSSRRSTLLGLAISGLRMCKSNYYLFIYTYYIYSTHLLLLLAAQHVRQLVFTHRLGQRQASVVLVARVVEVRLVKN
jgi:hypothetical protein